MTTPAIVVYPTPNALARNAADDFVAASRAAIGERGRFAVALSGGTTPKAMLAALAEPGRAGAINWPLVHVFWSDERCVPPDDERSNFKMAHDTLLAHVPLPLENIHRMKGELEPAAGADDYVAELARFFGDATAFDLLYLGLGPDGHAASLFPGTAALGATASCVANRVDSGVASPWRLTLTYPAINTSRRVVFLVQGTGKADIVRHVLRDPRDVEVLPAQGIDPASGDLRMYLDVAAASKLGS